MTDLQLQTEAERATGRLTLGGRFGESTSEGYLDALQPLLGGDHAILFLNPKLSGSDDDEQEWSLGLGGRLLLPAPNVILGANVFYDERETQHNHRFGQVGAGIEALSRWVDARANYYWPDDKQEIVASDSQTRVDRSSDTWWGDIYAKQYQLKQNQYTRVTTTTTTRHFERFEAALEGYDAEIGVRLPYLPDWLEARVFGGYYAFEGDFTDDIDGFKGRMEVRALPALVFDAEVYENDDLTGSDYFFGARLDLPFDVANLARGKNPFEGLGRSLKPTRRELRDRLSDMVMRDPHVRIHESGWIENADLLQVERDSDTSSRSFVVLDDVNFVNNVNQTGFENGTAENPWNTVQEGVDAASGLKNVYVFQGVARYRENVRVENDGVQLLGEGCEIEGFGGETFGGGKYPQLDGNVGGVNGPVLRVTADDVLIRGFEITRTPGGSDPGQLDDLFGTHLIDRVGILAENADNLTIACNKINSQSTGIMDLYYATSPGEVQQHNIQIHDNTIEDMDENGIHLDGMGGGSYTATVRNNTIRNFGQDGLGVLLDGGLQDINLLVEDNRFFDGPNVGVYLRSLRATNVQFAIRNNQFDVTTPILAFVDEVGNDLVEEISGNTSLQGAITLFNPLVPGDAVVRVDGNTLSGSGSSLTVFMDTVLNDLEASLSGNRVSDGSGGITFFGGVVGGNLALAMDDNELVNTLGGISAFMDIVGGHLNASLSGNRLVGGASLSYFGSLVGGNMSLAIDNNEVIGAAGGGVNAFLDPVGGDLFASFSGNRIEDAGGGGLSIFSPTAGGDVTLVVGGNRVTGSGGNGISIFGVVAGGNVMLDAVGNTADDNSGLGFVADVAGAGGDADIRVLDSSFDGNGGGGLNLSATGIGGDLNILVDPTTANGNAGVGVLVAATAVSNVNVILDQVTASDNAGVGVFVSAGSLSGSVQAAFLDVTANGNGAGGVNVNLSALDEVLLGDFDIPANTVVGNRITANNNGGIGFQATASSASGTVFHFSEEIIATNNTGVGILLTMASPDNAYSFIDRAVANNNGGFGLIQTLGAETAFLDLGQGQFNGNASGGMVATVAGSDIAGVFLGQEANFLFPLPNRNLGPIEANDNLGPGIQLTLASGGVGLLIADEVEASRNNGGGITASIAADDDVIALFGSRINGFTNPTISEVRADNNAAGGITLVGVSTTGSVNAALGGGSASGNGSVGASLTLVGQEEVSLMLGGSLFETFGAVSDFAPFVANSNGANGITAVLSSSAGAALFGFMGGGASGNAGSGLLATLSSGSGLTGVFGDVVPDAGATPLRFNDNVGGGLVLTGVTASNSATVITGGLEGNRNGASGLTLTLSSAGDVSFLGGISGLMSDPETRRIQANDNGGHGFAYSGSAANDNTFFASWLEANGNAGVGSLITVSAGAGDIDFGLGHVLGMLPGIQGTQGLFASSNGSFGANASVSTGNGDINVFGGEWVANDNASGGVSLSLISGAGDVAAHLGLAQAGTNMVSAPVKASNNGGIGIAAVLVSGLGAVSYSMPSAHVTNNASDGLAVTASAGSGDILMELGEDSLFNVEGEVYASHNAGRGVGITASSGAGSVDINLSHVTAISNTVNGVTAIASSVWDASLALDDVQAIGNGLYGVSATAATLSSNATVTANNLVLNHNGATGGLFYASGGAAANVTVTNFTADANNGHGVVGAVDGTVDAQVLVNGSASGNTNWGVVAVAVGSGGAIVSGANAGSGNGGGETWTATAGVGSYETLLPP